MPARLGNGPDNLLFDKNLKSMKLKNKIVKMKIYTVNAKTKK